MKKTSLSILSIGILAITLYNCISLKKSKTPTSFVPLSELGEYGKYVFDRENCIKCHTFKIEEANSNKISLDGQKGRRGLAWYYTYLDNPSAFESRSGKQSYGHLHARSIEKSTFELIYQNKEDINSAWNNLTKESDSIYSAVNKVISRAPLKKNNYKEIFALISYLEQIPSSKEKKRLDSIASIKRMNEENKWENEWNTFVNDTTSKFYSVLKSKKSIEKGKLIFNKKCLACHGRNAEGVIGPNHTDNYWLHGNSVSEIATTIANGIPEKGMQSWRYELSPVEIAQIVAFLKSVEGTNLSGKNPQGIKR